MQRLFRHFIPTAPPHIQSPAPAAPSYPARPIRVVAGYMRSGVTEGFARLLARKLGDQLGQSIVLDDRPGMAGTRGLVAVARAAPDGYTLLMNNTTTMSVAPHVCSTLPQAARSGGFAPVVLMSRVPQGVALDLRVANVDLLGLVERLRASGAPVDGIYAPPGTPGAIVDRLARAVRAAMRGPEAESLLLQEQAALVLLTGPALHTFFDEEELSA